MTNTEVQSVKRNAIVPVFCHVRGYVSGDRWHLKDVTCICIFNLLSKLTDQNGILNYLVTCCGFSHFHFPLRVCVCDYKRFMTFDDC